MSDFVPWLERFLFCCAGYVGSPSYIAPELLQQSARYDVRVDMYSFGVLIWSLLQYLYVTHVFTSRRTPQEHSVLMRPFGGTVLKFHNVCVCGYACVLSVSCGFAVTRRVAHPYCHVSSVVLLPFCLFAVRSALIRAAFHVGFLYLLYLFVNHWIASMSPCYATLVAQCARVHFRAQTDSALSFACSGSAVAQSLRALPS